MFNYSKEKMYSEDDEGDESNPDFENGQSEPTKNFSKLEKHWWQPTPGFSVTRF